MKIILSNQRGPASPKLLAYGLLELMFSTVVGVVVLGAVLVTLGFMNRTLNATSNYAELDRQSRNALDQMTRDIRMSGGLTNYTTTSLLFTNKDGTLLRYDWNTNTQNLVCSNYSSGATLSNLLLKGCVSLQFTVFQRNPLSNSTMLFSPITNNNPALVKVIVMDWICRRTNYTTLTDSESVQTAKVVLRN